MLMSKRKNLKHSETSLRSLVKSISYRLVIIVSIFIISFLTTGDLGTTATITGITAITGTILYYLHERVWSVISWGRK